ncbi:hypothetical protein PVAP13_3KG419927 [Panicum virgatum]|uniref:Secreted protein n=1 Tax=Panicum virgatum TaxID=38727 RepID=A0A8T0V5V3_PANVG|nr:hypothetical protein PVAP13_3KG419927 [Panicum virgatum]
MAHTHWLCFLAFASTWALQRRFHTALCWPTPRTNARWRAGTCQFITTTHFFGWVVRTKTRPQRSIVTDPCQRSNGLFRTR